MNQEEPSDCEDEDVSSEVSGSKLDSLNLNSLDCWDYSIELECLKGPEDLQLAAELGKTLLERNKELETNLRQCQNLIDEQAQEIEEVSADSSKGEMFVLKDSREDFTIPTFGVIKGTTFIKANKVIQYLTKQSAALRKANDNRIRIYEHLEVSIQELERANQKLALDNATDKKQIKSLHSYRDMLEARCEELQKALEEARVQQTIQKEKLRRMSSTKGEDEAPEESTKTSAAVTQTSIDQTEEVQQIPTEEDLISQLSIQNQELRSHMSREQRKIADLEEEITRRIQDMALLEEELSQREEQVKSLREKISNLEEIRSENLCAKCLKEMDVKIPQELQMLFDPEEDEISMNGKYCNSVHLDLKEDNPYRTLANMYESIVKEQSENRKLSTEFSKSSPLNCLSLRDELKPFDLYKDRKEDEEIQKEEDETKEQRNATKNKMFMTTAADLSEAETSSSGYSDETSNKWTQTERNMIPGSFLCSIADGDDCKFSIYDDACPIESRFRKTPEYRTLFREIFAVLKRAAEAKDNGEQLPLLNDLTPVSETLKVPPVTPAKEEAPLEFEPLQSLPESSNVSETASESAMETIKDPDQEDSPTQEASESSNATRDKGSTNDLLEYISVEIRLKNKSKRRSTNSPGRQARVSEMVEKIEGSSPNLGRKSGRRRKEWKNYDSPRSSSRNQTLAIQPHVLTTLERKESFPSSYSRNSGSPRTSSWAFQPFVSTAAQEVAQLKKLEKSYAEVLRHTPSPKNFSRPKSLRLVS